MLREGPFDIEAAYLLLVNAIKVIDRYQSVICPKGVLQLSMKKNDSLFHIMHPRKSDWDILPFAVMDNRCIVEGSIS